MTAARRVGVALLLAGSAAGCVYYNAMWSAERSAAQARRAEAHGDVGRARGLWIQAAAKAESVHVRHPRSKWADDARVLHAEGLVRGGQCARAAEVLDSAAAAATTRTHRERVALAAAACALDARRPDRVPALLQPALDSPDPRHRSRAHALAGEAAALRGDPDAALDHYARSEEPGATLARVRLLFSLDRDAAALALAPALTQGGFVEATWTALLTEVARQAGPEQASALADRVLARMRVPVASRTRLLLADGDRLSAAGRHADAATRYAAAAAGPPDQTETLIAATRAVRARAALAETVDALAALPPELDRIGARTGSPAAAEAARLADVIRTVAAPDSSEVGVLRAAELARDSLQAVAVAAVLFRRFADWFPASLFAAKALVAALALEPDAERAGALRARLDGQYAESPYVQALRGEPSPGYGAAEDSLARALGLTLGRALAATGLRVGEPHSGPLGPWEDPEPTRGDREVAATEPETEGPRRPVGRDQPTRPPPRPVTPGQPRP